MKKLLSLHFRPMPLSAHFDFFTKLLVLLTAAGADLKAAIAALLPGFKAWLEKESALMQWVRKSALTEKIAEADHQVDSLLVGINAIVQSALHSTFSAIMESGRRVHIMLKSYGDVAHASYDKEAGDVRALLEQFNGPYAQDKASLGLATWIQALETAFNTFESLLGQREAEQGEKPPYKAQEVRKGIEDAYHQMAYIINAHSAVGTSGDFDAFIDTLNPNIERLNAEFSKAKKDLAAGDHTVIEPIETQQYTGRPVTIIPKVYYREDGKPTENLSLGDDFNVTYKNNTNVGTAELTIHGKGGYKGQKTVTFNIAR